MRVAVAGPLAMSYLSCMTKTTHTNKLPVWFIDPNSGDVIEVDLATATYARQENLRKRFVRETEQLIIAATEGF